jgi:hypothetical protein
MENQDSVHALRTTSKIPQMVENVKNAMIRVHLAMERTVIIVSIAIIRRKLKQVSQLLV